MSTFTKKSIAKALKKKVDEEKTFHEMPVIRESIFQLLLKDFHNNEFHNNLIAETYSVLHKRTYLSHSRWGYL